MTSFSSPARSVTVGAVVAVSALAALGAAAVVELLVARYTRGSGWMTIPAVYPLLIGSALAGLLLVIRPCAGAGPAVVVLVCAVQVLGGGLAASRDWFNTSGATGLPMHRLTVVLPLTMVLVVAATIMCCVALWSVAWSTPAWRPASPVLVVAGLAVAVSVPLGWAALTGWWAVTSLGQVALSYSLPWGAGLAVAGWLEPRPRRIAVIAVLAGVLAAAAGFGAQLLTALALD